MKLEKLAELIIETLEDNKATNILTLDVRNLASFADLMIIASGTSTKQVTSIAEKLIEKAKKIRSRHTVQKANNMANGYWLISETLLCTSCTRPHVHITNWKNSGHSQMTQIPPNKPSIN